MSRRRDWLQLMRPPNALTAVADPLAGAFLAGPVWADLPGILIVMVASACLYTGGIVLNDWHDYKQDLVERPERPLPSGRIRRLNALFVAILLLSAGPLITALLPNTVNQIAVLLLLAILTYDILLKHTPISPGLMGLCRTLNLLLGVSVVGFPQGGPGMRLVTLAAILMWIYVVGITVFARHEAQGRHRNVLIGAGVATWAATIGVAAIPLLVPQGVDSRAGLIWSAALMAVLGFRMTQAMLTPTPPLIQAAVKAGVLCIILLDAALVGFSAGLLASILVAVLIVPAIVLGRKLATT